MRRFSLMSLILSLVVVGCSNEVETVETFERPVAKPGEIITVISKDTPEVIEGSILEDLEVGTDGTLYLAYTVEDVGYLIIAVSARGRPKVLADSRNLEFPEPSSDAALASLALDDDSRTLYVADQEGWIHAIDDGGKRRNIAKVGRGLYEGPSNSPLRFLSYLAFDPSTDVLYVADQCQVARLEGKKVVVVAGVPHCRTVPPDAAIPTFGPGVPASQGRIDSISGLAVDTDNGDLFLAVEGDIDGVVGEVFRIDHQGEVSRILEGGKAPPGDREELSSRSSRGGGLAFHVRSNALFAADPVQGIIRRVGRDGAVTTVAGTGALQTSGDGGPAQAAALDGPARLAVDVAGNLYLNGTLYGETVRTIGAPES